MPYIDQESRDRITITGIPTSPGELNYLITTLILKKKNDPDLVESIDDAIYQYMKHKGSLSYGVINDILGALDGAKREFKRRSTSKDEIVAATIETVSESFYSDVAAPYEDKKIRDNGDLPY